MARTPATQLTLKRVRKEGYSAVVAEKRLPIPDKFITVDLFGFVDVCAIRSDCNGVFGIQATSTPNIAAHVTKAMNIPELMIWLQAGNRFEIWGWQNKEKGTRYKLSRREFYLEGNNIIIDKIKEVT